MIRKNQNQTNHRPLYRVIVRSAWHQAWHHKRLWLFAILAAILQTGGIFDVLLVSWRDIGSQADAVAASGFWHELFGLSLFSGVPSAAGWFASLQIWQSIIFWSLFVFLIVALSIIAQGALVAGLGGKMRGRELTLRECFSAGVNSFGTVALLNVFTLGLMRFARFVMLIPLADSLRTPTMSSVVVYVIAAFLYLVLVVALTVIHMFALNALVLQDASLREAIVRGFDLLRRGWLITIESAAVLFAIGFLIMLGSLVVFFLVVLPLFLLGLLAAFLSASVLATLVEVLVLLLSIVVVLAAGAFSILFQYAVWQALYRRLGEGGAFAKLHRWVKWLTGDYQSTEI